MPGENDYDVLVIGSGFGGSVAALRLTEKGYRVGVLEAGRRFEDADYPRTSWDARRFLWAPKLGCLGIQRIHLLRNVIILAGAGVGGGSLAYANTLYEPKDAFFGGAGPSRRGCLEAGECMTGCRHNAKNTLVKNYLYLAERAGAAVHPETTAVAVRPSGRSAARRPRCATGRSTISPAGWPSPRPSTRTIAPRSNPFATARARTRWGCSAR